MFNLENYFMHLIEFLHFPFKYKLNFFFQDFKDILSILIVSRPGGGNHL